MLQITLRPLKKCMVLITMLLCLLPVFTCAEESAEPIHIEADRMISQEDKNSVVFSGNVDAKQGNVIIRSQEMTVYYSPSEDASGNKTSSQIEKLICKQDVEITQDDWLGTGKRMDYFAKERKVILSGDAKAWQGQNMVAGKTITYFLDEKRSIVENVGKNQQNTGRVSATLHPEQDKK